MPHPNQGPAAPRYPHPRIVLERAAWEVVRQWEAIVRAKANGQPARDLSALASEMNRRIVKLRAAAALDADPIDRGADILETLTDLFDIFGR